MLFVVVAQVETVSSRESKSNGRKTIFTNFVHWTEREKFLGEEFFYDRLNAQCSFPFVAQFVEHTSLQSTKHRAHARKHTHSHVICNRLWVDNYVGGGGVRSMCIYWSVTNFRRMISHLLLWIWSPQNNLCCDRVYAIPVKRILHWHSRIFLFSLELHFVAAAAVASSSSSSSSTSSSSSCWSLSCEWKWKELVFVCWHSWTVTAT